MDVYYYKSIQPNLGDDLNAWLWHRLMPQRLAAFDDTLLLGIGTIIGQRCPESARTIVFTSGAGYNAVSSGIDYENWQFLAVRGPLTAEVLELPRDVAVTDGAILVSLFPEYFTPVSERQGTVFMPHLSAARAVDWRPICNAAGIEYLDPRDEHFTLLKRLGSARLVLADAMHAAIVADSLRVPWIPISTSAEINTFKWLDWTLSLELPYEPVELLPMSWLQFAQELVIGITGQRHRVRSTDPKSVIAAYRRLVRRKKERESQPTRYLNWGVVKGYNWISRREWLATARFNIDSNVACLRRLQHREGYLSTDGVFTARRQELLRRMDGLL